MARRLRPDRKAFPMSSEAPYFAEGSLPRRMASFSVPLVVANLLQYLYQLSLIHI